MLSSVRSRPGDNDASLKSGIRDLDWLLSRLESQILSQDADPALRHSVYLRRKSEAVSHLVNYYLRSLAAMRQ